MRSKRNELRGARLDCRWLLGSSLIALVIGLTGCTGKPEATAPIRYITEYGLGPDKWASAWLLVRHVSPNADLAVGAPGAPLESGVSFDLPTSQLRRIGNQPTFEAVRARFQIQDPVVATMAAIVYDIEVNFWAKNNHADAAIVEEAYRSLQYRHGRDAVTPECYVAFFDRVYEVLRDAQEKSIPVSAERLWLSCGELMQLSTRDRQIIHEVPVVDLLSATAAGRKVVYVDVRESDEFAESHLPGALNIPIRDVTPALREQLSGADYVVSYCVKDFRGYEMAKALSQIGVKNSVIMRPYGIKGWIAMGLPVTGEKALSEDESHRELDECLQSVGACLAEAGAST